MNAGPVGGPGEASLAPVCLPPPIGALQPLPFEVRAMTRVLIVATAALSLSAVLLLAGSGAASAATFAPISLSAAPPQPIALLLPPRSFGPDGCGEKKTVIIDAKGGTFSIPTCDGWSGIFAYPPTKEHNVFHFKVTCSVTDNFGPRRPPKVYQPWPVENVPGVGGHFSA